MSDRKTLPVSGLSFTDTGSNENVNLAAQGLNAFGLNLKAALDDIYTQIKPPQPPVTDPAVNPANIKVQLDLEGYNRAVRSHNGSIEGLSDSLKAPRKIVDPAAAAWTVTDVSNIPATISVLNDNAQTTDTVVRQLLADLGLTADLTQGSDSTRKRQLRIALGLNPFPININII